MKPMARAAILTTLRDGLEARGSWAGETHMQKATFFLQEGAGVPLPFEFILYKFGPFSFDLRDELISFRAKHLMGIEIQDRYGPRLSTTDEGRALQERFPRTLDRFRPQIEVVTGFLNSKGVGELERLGTALMFQLENHDLDDESIAERICKVKPHVDEKAAIQSSAEVRRFLADVALLG